MKKKREINFVSILLYGLVLVVFLGCFFLSAQAPIPKSMSESVVSVFSEVAIKIAANALNHLW